MFLKLTGKSGRACLVAIDKITCVHYSDAGVVGNDHSRIYFTGTEYPITVKESVETISQMFHQARVPYTVRMDSKDDT